MKARSLLLALCIPLIGRAETPPVPASDATNAGPKPMSPLLQKFEEANCHGDNKTLLALIDQGLDTKEIDPYGNSALALATRFGRIEVMKALIAHGADAHLRYGNDSILGSAIQSRNADEVAFLLAHGVGANEPIDDVNDTPLMEAARLGQMEMVNMLLVQGADVKAHNQDGVDALDDAANYGHADIIALLIDHGADPNRGGLHGEMPLNWAARSGWLDAVKVLVQKGAKPDVPNGPDGMTPIATACCGPTRPGRDEVGVIQFLVQHGAKVSTPDRKGYTPLMRAAATYARLDIIQALVAAGADIHSPDGDGAKAFRQALQQGRPNSPPAVQALLNAGANPNWTVQNDYSALFYSIEIRPNAEIVAALVQAKADVNATRHQPFVGESTGPRPPDYVYSVLIAAVRRDSVPIAKILLEAGANAHYQDSEGKTALDRAQEKPDPDMIALLEKYP